MGNSNNRIFFYFDHDQTIEQKNNNYLAIYSDVITRSRDHFRRDAFDEVNGLEIYWRSGDVCSRQHFHWKWGY